MLNPANTKKERTKRKLLELDGTIQNEKNYFIYAYFT